MEERFTRGYYPLLFDTLPEMPFWKDFVPFRVEPVEKVGSNPLRSTSMWSLCRNSRIGGRFLRYWQPHLRWIPEPLPRYCLLAWSYLAFTSAHPRLSGLLTAHILSKMPLENFTHPQHWENSLCSFVMRISLHKRMAVSLGISSIRSPSLDDIELVPADNSTPSRSPLRRKVPTSLTQYGCTVSTGSEIYKTAMH